METNLTAVTGFFGPETTSDGRLEGDTTMEINLTTVTGFFGPEITGDGRLNPVYLAIASRSYRIQSHTLHIPDRSGFFSPGPPASRCAKVPARAPWFLAMCF